MKPATSSHHQALSAVAPGKFITLEPRLLRGGSLQARKLANGAVHLYWRYTYEGKTSREPIGLYDSSAPPRKLQQTVKGFGIAAAMEHCDALAKRHTERLNTGGLAELKAEERQQFKAKQVARLENLSRTLEKLLSTYVEHLKAQGRRSYYDADQLFRLHVQEPWPDVWQLPATEVTSDHVLDLQRKLIEAGKGRTSNKLRSYLRAAYQCAIDVRTTASIPVAFKVFAITLNPAAQTKRDGRFDRADKRPLAAAEMRIYWQCIQRLPGLHGAALRLHLLTGGQRIEQLLRLRWRDVSSNTMLIFDGKGRPGIGPRPHLVPLLDDAVITLETLKRDGEYVLSTTLGVRPVSATTLSGWARDAVGSLIGEFQLKRIRSGVETLLASNRISREVRGHLQSHGMTGIQFRHYDGHDYLPEKRHALELLLSELNRLP